VKVGKNAKSRGSVAAKVTRDSSRRRKFVSLLMRLFYTCFSLLWPRFRWKSRGICFSENITEFLLLSGKRHPYDEWR